MLCAVLDNCDVDEDQDRISGEYLSE
jgi:hypothetical protein